MGRKIFGAPPPLCLWKLEVALHRASFVRPHQPSCYSYHRKRSVVKRSVELVVGFGGVIDRRGSHVVEVRDGR